MNTSADITAPSGLKVFRDLGGTLTADGRRIRSGRIFRSGDLSALTRADLDRLRSLGIRLVCDLRSEFERTARPSQWPEDLQTERLIAGLLDVRTGQLDLRRMLIEDPTPAGVRRMMLATYEALPAAAAPLLPQLFARLANDQLPALIHCSAGKDRTGFICACIQHALGVDRETILKEYLAIREHLAADAMASRIAEHLRALVGDAAAERMVKVLSDVDADYLDAAFAVIDREHGSLARYLSAAGVTDETVTRIQQQLLDGSSSSYSN
jgi:protein-tyrosine phosphatase